MKKKIILGLILAVAAAGAVFAFSRYTLVGGKLYPRDSAVLDLRGQELKPEDYAKLTEKLPNADIQFELSFQGGTVPGDATEVSVATLTEEDAQILASLPKLRTVSRCSRSRVYSTSGVPPSFIPAR